MKNYNMQINFNYIYSQVIVLVLVFLITYTSMADRKGLTKSPIIKNNSKIIYTKKLKSFSYSNRNKYVGRVLKLIKPILDNHNLSAQLLVHNDPTLTKIFLLRNSLLRKDKSTAKYFTLISSAENKNFDELLIVSSET
jgi:hypothetical protein